jgi:hypothetical protein
MNGMARKREGFVRTSLMVVVCLIVMGGASQSWAGSAWVVQSSPNPGRFSVLSGVSAPTSTDAWAVGSYNDPMWTCATLVEHYDGSSWTQVASPNVGDRGNFLFSVKMASTTNGWAVGTWRNSPKASTLILHYNGTKWLQQNSPNPSPNEDMLLGIAAGSSTAAWAVGFQGGGFTANCRILQGPVLGRIGTAPTSGRYTPLVEHYGGNGWTVASAASVGRCGSILQSASAFDTSEAVAAGYSATGSDCTAPTYSTLIEVGNDRTWLPVTTPNVAGADNYLDSVSATSLSDIWAVGEYTTSDGVERGLILHDNGTKWTITKVVHGDFNALFGVKAASPTDVWAVGAYTKNGANRLQILHYDGTRWTIQSGPGVSGQSELFGVGATNSYAFAVGIKVGGHGQDTLVLHNAS